MIRRKRKAQEGELVEEPVVKIVIMDQEAFERAVRVGAATDNEVGFYMIGIIRDHEAFVYDIIEFPYSEKSPTLIASDPAKVARVFSIIPLGLTVIGIMHKHPDTIGSTFSSIDAKTFVEWAREGVHAHVIFSKNGRDVSAYTVVKNKIVKIDFVTKKNLVDELRIGYIPISTRIPFLYHSEDTFVSLITRLEKGLTHSVLKEISPLKPTNAKIFEKVPKSNALEFEKRSRILVAPRKGLLVYEFIFPQEKKFGEVKEEIIKVLGLTTNSVFICEGALVDDKTILRELHGKIIRVQQPVEKIVEELIEARIRKLEQTILSTLKDYLSKAIEEEVKQLRKIIKKELKKEVKKIVKEALREVNATNKK